MRVPETETHIDPPLVAALLHEQHPDLAALPLQLADHGWDNVMYRLGQHLAVRLPRRELGAQCLLREQAWLPQLASRLPLPVPAPTRIGEPSHGYPWRWSVLPWLEGHPADLSPIDASQAATLAEFLRALHVPAPADAPKSECRGVPLSLRAQVTAERIDDITVSGRFDARLQRLWEDALASNTSGPRTWLHGDLHARNVLCREGRITGVIDWGDLCAGDYATDLAAVWMLLDEVAAREQAMTLYPTDAASWTRARGWALYFGVLLAGLREPSETRYRNMGERILSNLLAGP